MQLHLSSLSTLAATLFLLGACITPVVLTGNSGGSGGSSTATTGSAGGGPTTATTGSAGGGPTTATTGTTGSGGSGNTCVAAGGTCEFTSPGACLHGVVGEDQFSCGPAVGSICCLPCANVCTTAGDTRCAGGGIQTCKAVNTCLEWVPGDACAENQGCNSAGTQCIPTSATCTSDAQCGCGCGCGGGECHCTGGLPPTCDADSDCGPTCDGFVCSNHVCAQQVCTPGTDQTCNDNAGMNAPAGACNPDGTCACKAGFTIKASSGKCG